MERAQGLISYPVPWKLVLGLGPNVMQRRPTSVDAFSAGVCEGMMPKAMVSGQEQLPESPRFVLVANHYQRKGLWILHPASVLTQAIRQRYGPGDPPVKWMVTANWPRMRFGPFSFASPGDVLLPRVADALACYPVSFAGSNQAFTARSLRRILREAKTAERPLGLFPEGVSGTAGQLTDPLPGVDRLLAHLAKSGLPVQPAAIWETDRLNVRFGETVSVAELLDAANPATLAMSQIQNLLGANGLPEHR